jgi:predicted transcriptional regulator
MQVIWEVGEASVKDIQDRLPGDRHYNSVLTIIRVLERKGHLVHRVDGRAYIYSASENHENVRRRVLAHLIENVFGGSAASMVLQLVETGDLTKNDIEQIRRKLAVRDSRGGKQ